MPRFGVLYDLQRITKSIQTIIIIKFFSNLQCIENFAGLGKHTETILDLCAILS